MRRFDARMDGSSIGTFDHLEEALEALCLPIYAAIGKGQASLPEVTDRHQDLPLDEQTIWDWFEAWLLPRRAGLPLPACALPCSADRPAARPTRRIQSVLPH